MRSAHPDRLLSPIFMKQLSSTSDERHRERLVQTQRAVASVTSRSGEDNPSRRSVFAVSGHRNR